MFIHKECVPAEIPLAEDVGKRFAFHATFGHFISAVDGVRVKIPVCPIGGHALVCARGKGSQFACLQLGHGYPGGAETAAQVDVKVVDGDGHISLSFYLYFNQKNPGKRRP